MRTADDCSAGDGPEATAHPGHDVEVADMIAGCAAGDGEALRRLYAAQAPRLYAVALRLLRDRTTADEVLQEMFLQVWRNAARFDPARGNGEVWLMSLLRYRALDVLRQRRREKLTDDPDLGDAAEPAVALDRIVDAEVNAALRRCLELLDDKNRRCILLAYLDGCSHSEIAGRLALPLGTVKAWIRRGLSSLKTCLAPA